MKKLDLTKYLVELLLESLPNAIITSTQPNPCGWRADTHTRIGFRITRKPLRRKFLWWSFNCQPRAHPVLEVLSDKTIRLHESEWNKWISPVTEIAKEYETRTGKEITIIKVSQFIPIIP